MSLVVRGCTKLLHDSVGLCCWVLRWCLVGIRKLQMPAPQLLAGWGTALVAKLLCLPSKKAGITVH